ncbi:hypothetical protein PPUN12996_05310 [Pseudomonas putida]|nr:hypothetical protein PPUN12996_05310 [Pseudomonas putida]
MQVLADLLADFGDGRFDFGFGVQAVSFTHDLTDMLEIGGHGALRGCILEKRAKVRIRSSQIKHLWTNVQNDQTTAQAE